MEIKCGTLVRFTVQDGHVGYGVVTDHDQWGWDINPDIASQISITTVDIYDVMPVCARVLPDYDDTTKFVWNNQTYTLLCSNFGWVAHIPPLCTVEPCMQLCNVKWAMAKVVRGIYLKHKRCWLEDLEEADWYKPAFDLACRVIP